MSLFTILFARLVDLRDEYFNGLNRYDLFVIYAMLDKNKVYSSDELIDIMSNYCDMSEEIK